MHVLSTVKDTMTIIKDGTVRQFAWQVRIDVSERTFWQVQYGVIPAMIDPVVIALNKESY